LPTPDACHRVSLSAATPIVFQAEIYAILVCGLVLLSEPKRGGRTVICSDSKTAIEANEVRSKLVMECKSTLEALSRVLEHTGISDNMEADRLAGLGTKKPLSGPEPSVGSTL